MFYGCRFEPHSSHVLQLYKPLGELECDKTNKMTCAASEDSDQHRHQLIQADLSVNGAMVILSSPEHLGSYELVV